MANEYLKRTPTSTGNTRVYTLSCWVKKYFITNSADIPLFHAYDGSASNRLQWNYRGTEDTLAFNPGGTSNQFQKKTVSSTGSNALFRDVSSWTHVMLSVDITAGQEAERCRIYINGVRQPLTNVSGYSDIVKDISGSPAQMNTTVVHHILGVANSSTADAGNANYKAQLLDYYMVDGQALTPDVFGFYKDGNGYISAGSNLSTDFKPGQWVPKPPRIIKADINSRGGFGVNGFYLPMNSSNNFGADFHCTPNSILKLKEDLPQPKVEIDGVGDYTGALRDDPFKQYLIFAQPNVSGGLQNGYGDYSHIIRGSGSPKTVTLGGSPTISSTQSLYYGSSLYFDGNDTINVETGNSNYLGQDFTIEFWVWHDAAYPQNQMIFNTIPHVSFGISLNRGFSGQTALYVGNGSTWQTLDFRSGGRLYSQQWNHVVVERYNNAITIYHNGVAQGTTTAFMPTGYSSLFRYGTYDNNTAEPVVGYIQDYRVYSGIAKYKGGFDVPRPYTPVGIATWRAVPDTTANNFATWNAVDRVSSNGLTLSDGNLSITNGASYRAIRATVGIPTTGKWYYEHRESTARLSNVIGSVGIATNGHAWDLNSFYDSFSGIYWGSSGLQFPINGTGTGQWISSPGIGGGDVINIAYDADSRNLWLGINGTYYTRSGSTMTGNGDPSTGTNPTGTVSTTYSNLGLFPFNNAYSTTSQTNFGQNPTFSGNTTAGTFTDSNGKGLFKYQPPSGFLALCEDNLPTPAIKNPGEYFKTVLWTGDGNSGRSITGVGFQPDLVWLKSRTNSASNRLSDAVRGVNKQLMSNTTETEATFTTMLTSFDSDGFTLGDNVGINGSGYTNVAWCWKAGGAAVSNTDGTITSQVSANQDAGFSIATYTATGSTGSIGHGLGKTPAFVITKHRNLDTHWRIWHKGLSGYNYTLFFNTGAEQVQPAYSALPTDSVINLASDLTGSYNFVTYCWTEIEGFSKFGSYVGNGSADGPFVYCGFKPAWVMVKRSSAGENWAIIDSSRNPTNVATNFLRADETAIETTAAADMDLLSNGFKLRGTDTKSNGSGTYIFAAFAESPFQTANSK